ncbi:MAG: hypothetical protein IPK81_00515 [Rhodospirillales bacterium]|nr:MAG: hypothetical protein IPK81_00515 [Rhodospirillales bacterium]
MATSGAPPSAPVPRARVWAIRLACAIGLALAIGFAYGAWMREAERRHMSAVGVVAEAVVTGHKEVRGSGRGVGGAQYVHYFPVVRFKTAAGAAVEAPLAQRLDLDQIKVGQVTRIVYDPAEPTRAHFAETVAAGVDGTAIYLAVAAIVIGVACAALLFRRRAA